MTMSAEIRIGWASRPRFTKHDNGHQSERPTFLAAPERGYRANEPKRFIQPDKAPSSTMRGVRTRLFSLLYYLARAVVGSGGLGCAWVTEDPSTEARHQEEDHQGNCRDSEISVCAVRSFRPSNSWLSLHSYSPMSESDRPIIADESKAKETHASCRLLSPTSARSLSSTNTESNDCNTCQPTSAWPKKNRPPRRTDQPLIVNRDIT
jgi:hypothetical protein